MTDFCIDDHPVIVPETVSNAKSSQILQAVDASTFFELIDVRGWVNRDLEIIHVTALGDGIPDHNPYGFEYREPLVIIISSDDEQLPQVWGLREGFPIVPHLNESAAGFPPSLCLYFESVIAVHRTWTAEAFLRRVTWWLEGSSKGNLHVMDQPLEQLFFDSKYELILPSDADDIIGHGSAELSIDRVIARPDGGVTVVIGTASEPTTDLSLVILPLYFSPVVQGMIERAPRTLKELLSSFQQRGLDAKERLEACLNAYMPSAGLSSPKEGQMTMILTQVPITRTEGSPVELVQHQAYIAEVNPLELGEKLGSYIQFDGRYFNDTPILWNGIDPQNLDVPLEAVAVSQFNKQEDYLQQSGYKDQGPKGGLIGVGALGSVVFDCWNRSGWGDWILVDNDHIKPHNLTRHTADISCVGWMKSNVVKETGIRNTGYSAAKATVTVDALNTDSEEMKEVFSHSDLVVDASTTLDYPRRVGRDDQAPRHCSIFVTPSANSAVLMLEDRQRHTRLTSMEAQYYRAILNSKWGENHLAVSPGTFLSGTSCRDISFQLPFAKVMTHAANLADQVRVLQGKDTAAVRIWNRCTESGAVSLVDLDVGREMKAFPDGQEDGLAVIFDEILKHKLQRIRQAHLPNETGGILLGYHDFNINAIVVVDALLAPADSEGSPHSFQRGQAGVIEQVLESQRRTAGIVGYIGEWHSHPAGASALPSKQDIMQLVELSEKLELDGLSAISIIIAADELGIQVRPRCL